MVDWHPIWGEISHLVLSVTGMCSRSILDGVVTEDERMKGGIYIISRGISG